MNKFPERLKELRKTRKINQQALSKHLNYGYTAVANYESGRNQPSIDTLIQIAEFFNVTVDYLIGTADVPNAIEKITNKEYQMIQIYSKLDTRNKMLADSIILLLYENQLNIEK